MTLGEKIVLIVLSMLAGIGLFFTAISTGLINVAFGG